MAFRLILITPEQNHPNEADTIISVFKSGLKTLHLRKPSFSAGEMKAYLTLIPERFHSRIVIHSHYNLLKEFNLKGIHLTEKTKAKKLPLFFDIRKHSLSGSFHSTAEIRKARRKYDYFFLSPVFDSISKKNYKADFDKEELKEFLIHRRNIIALGGIDTKNINNLFPIGFAGAAVLGAVWQSRNPIAAFHKLRSEIL